jgi:hypothetical protein
LCKGHNAIKKPSGTTLALGEPVGHGLGQKNQRLILFNLLSTWMSSLQDTAKGAITFSWRFDPLWPGERRLPLADAFPDPWADFY